MSSSPDVPIVADGGAKDQLKHSGAIVADGISHAPRLSVAAERDLFDRYLARLAERVLATASGEVVPTRSRIANADIQRSLWLGMLACPAAAAARGRSGAFERFNPASQGFSFRVPLLPVTLEVRVSAAVYVALHPTLAEQQVAAASEQDDDAGVAAAAVVTAASASTKGRALATVWTKLPVGPVTIQVPLGPEAVGESTHGAHEFRAAFLAALPVGAELLRPRTHRGSLPRDADLSDEASWSSYQAANLIPASDVAGPTFVASIEVEVSAYEDGYEVFLTILNRTPEEEAQTADIAAAIAFPPRAVDTRLYEVQMSATVDTDIVPYSLEQVAASYRYDRTVNAMGLSCAVDVERLTDSNARTHTRLTTRYGSMTSTERILPRELGINGDAINTSFAAVAADPVSVASGLLAAARQAGLNRWKQLS